MTANRPIEAVKKFVRDLQLEHYDLLHKHGYADYRLDEEPVEGYTEDALHLTELYERDLTLLLRQETESKMSDLSPTNSVRRRIDLILNPEPDTASGQSIRFATNPKILDALESLITEAETKVQKAQLEHIINTKKSTLALRDYSGKHKEDIEVVGVIMLQDMLRQLEDDAALKETHDE